MVLPAWRLLVGGWSDLIQGVEVAGQSAALGSRCVRTNIPCLLLKQHVAAGRLGGKSGQGFYKY
jgi:3-hydroxyacyl-CoA dehydrogenase